MAGKNDLKRAIEMARQSIYDGAQFIGKWHEFDVYEPTFVDNEPRFIGFPQFILVKGNMIRWIENEAESRSIMQKFDSDED